MPSPNIPRIALNDSLSAETFLARLPDLVARIPAAYFQRQRWFRAKAKEVAHLGLRDRALVTAGSPSGALTLVDVTYADRTSDVYCVPLAIRPVEDARRLDHVDSSRQALIVVTLDGSMVLYDALMDGDFCCALLERIANGATLAGERGTFAFRKTSAYPEYPEPVYRSEAGGPTGAPGGPLAARCTARPLRAEQSNTSIVYHVDGHQLILKAFRQVENGVNPDVEIGDFLTTRTTFRHIPLLAGAVEYDDLEGSRYDLGMLQHFVVSQGDGWEYTLGQLRQFLARMGERVHPGSDTLLDARERRDAVRSLCAGYLQEAWELGAITGQLHSALASNSDDPDFTPEPVALADLEHWSADIQKRLDETLALLRRSLGGLAPGLLAQAQRVLDQEPIYRGAIADLTREGPGGYHTGALGMRTRTHGDYHLGQVLRTADSFVIVDFEGEPARPLAERRGKTSPLRDVAGMLRSFDYAATAGLREASDSTGLAPWAEAWGAVTVESYLHGYLDATLAHGAPFLPPSRDQVDRLLRAFELEKALYELSYELNNRPDWVAIPVGRLASWRA